MTRAKHYDAVGRQRTLPAKKMTKIRKAWAAGETAEALAAVYGVSQTTIRNICYNTPRYRDLPRVFQVSAYQPTLF